MIMILVLLLVHVLQFMLLLLLRHMLPLVISGTEQHPFAPISVNALNLRNQNDGLQHASLVNISFFFKPVCNDV